MTPYIYYLTPVNKHESYELGYVFLRTVPFKDNLKMFDCNPADFFKDDAQMDFFSVCGSGILLKKWINGRLYVAPCATCVHGDYRGQGLGKVLYKSFLKAVENYRQHIKTLPYLANHTIVENVEATSKEANRVYVSLEKENIIKFVKDSLRRDTRGTYFGNENNEAKGNIYKIKQFPSDLKMEYLKTIDLNGYYYYHHFCDTDDPKYELHEITRV